MLDVLQMTFPLWNCCKVPCLVNWKSAAADKEVGLVSLDSTKGTQMKLFGILAARWRSACVCNRQRVNVAAMKLCCIKYHIFYHIILLFQESVMRLKKPSYEIITALFRFMHCMRPEASKEATTAANVVGPRVGQQRDAVAGPQEVQPQRPHQWIFEAQMRQSKYDFSEPSRWGTKLFKIHVYLYCDFVKWTSYDFIFWYLLSTL